MSHPLFPQLGLRAALDAPQRQEEARRAVLARVHDVTGRGSSDFELFLEEGTPHAVILARAEAWGAELVVVGSQSASGVTGVVLGSVAERVIRHAHGPVLITRATPPSRRVLAGTDFSDPSLPAVRAAADEARRRGAKLTLLHALEVDLPLLATAGVPFGGYVPPRLPPEVAAELRKLADERLADALARCGVPDGERRVVEGAAGQALVKAAEELNAELVVVGTTGKTGLRRALLGSVASTVAQTAQSTVLVVRLHAGR